MQDIPTQNILGNCTPKNSDGEKNGFGKIGHIIDLANSNNMTEWWMYMYYPGQTLQYTYYAQTDNSLTPLFYTHTTTIWSQNVRFQVSSGGLQRHVWQDFTDPAWRTRLHVRRQNDPYESFWKTANFVHNI